MTVIADKPAPKGKEQVPYYAEVPKGKAAVVPALSRAPAGWKRFKLRADFQDEHRHGLRESAPTRCVLAKNRADAEAEYLASENLKADVTGFRWAVKELPD